MSDDTPQRRYTDCVEHGRMVEKVESGKTCMERLESELGKMREAFTDHVNSSSKSTIALLVGILMCFLTGVVGIYVNAVHQKGELSSQEEMTMLVKVMATAIKEAKK